MSTSTGDAWMEKQGRERKETPLRVWLGVRRLKGWTQKRRRRRKRRERRVPLLLHRHLKSICQFRFLRGSEEGGAARGPRAGEFQSGDSSGRSVEWREERERELVCVRVDGGRIELWETDGWGRVVC